MRNDKLIKVVVAVAVLVLIGIGVWYKTRGAEDYSVVYLSTGEVYVGKLSTFPELRLKDAYILVVTQDPADKTKNNFQLNPIKEALWAPKYMRLVRENVVFYGPLLPESKIAKTLAGQTKPAQ